MTTVVLILVALGRACAGLLAMVLLALVMSGAEHFIRRLWARMKPARG